MNNQGKLDCIIVEYDNSINVIVMCLRSSSIRTRTLVLEILAAVCLIPNGHKKVMEAITAFVDYAGETKRFETVVKGLLVENQRVNGPTKTQIEVRHYIRNELINLGITNIIQKLSVINDDLLQTQIAIYKRKAKEDEEEMNKTYQGSFETDDATLLFDSLNKVLKNTRNYNQFLNFLKLALLIPKDTSEGSSMWTLINLITQQIVLQKNGFNPDPKISLINIDVNKAVSNLKVVEEKSKKRKERDDKKHELEILYGISDKKDNSSELHQHRCTNSLPSEPKLTLKSAINAIEKSLTFTSKYKHRKNCRIVYSRRSSRTKKAFSHTRYKLLNASIIEKIYEVVALSNQLKDAKKELATL
ncbi:hypothetical protein PIROE2DRAFT_61947 [Piromyces sp. E2]|nr:hypothetical protein PIROE2DRAFT_61947 [Piromyces sp. E2]|eukprot:OUM62357.1 hypothetical protein PIROE2DRAFT_61947 [Piromyces sp. E2]